MVEPLSIASLGITVLNTLRGLAGGRSKLRVMGSQGRLDQNPASRTFGQAFKGGRFIEMQEIGNEVVTVTAVNTGDRTIAVDQAGIEWRNKTRAVLTNTSSGLPTALAPGETLSAWGQASNLDGVMQGQDSPPSHPYVRDAAGKIYKGKFDEHFTAWLDRRLVPRTRQEPR